MRRPLLFLTTLLAVATAVALIVAAALVTSIPFAAPVAANEDVVRRFYDAVNEAVATGDPAALRAVVAPDFVEHDPLPGVESGRAGLEEYVTALHASVPGRRLVVEAVVAADDQVMGRVAVRHGEQTPVLGGVVGEPPPTWGPVDLFRVAGGLVVERWGLIDGLTLIQTLPEVSLDLPVPAPRVITVERVTIAPGGRRRGHAISGPRVLHLEAGTVRIETTAPGLASILAMAGWNGSGGTSGEGAAVTWDTDRPTAITPSLVVPTDGGYNVRNVGDEPARLVVVSFVLPGVPGGVAASIFADPPSDVVTRTLAGGIATEVTSGPAVLSLGWVTLARNARLSLSAGAGPVLIAVDTGRLSVVTTGTGWVRRGVDGMSTRRAEAVLEAEDGALLDPGGLMALENAGVDPVAALVVTLRPVPAASSASPPA